MWDSEEDVMQVFCYLYALFLKVAIDKTFPLAFSRDIIDVPKKMDSFMFSSESTTSDTFWDLFRHTEYARKTY